MACFEHYDGFERSSTFLEEVISRRNSRDDLLRYLDDGPCRIDWSLHMAANNVKLESVLSEDSRVEIRIRSDHAHEFTKGGVPWSFRRVNVSPAVRIRIAIRR